MGNFAKVCQLYLKCKANILIRKFFEVFGGWDWENPVQINEIKEEVDFVCTLTVWKKEHPIKLKDDCSFYIITPAFPAQNTNAGANQILKRVLIEEFNTYKEYSSKINIEDKNCEYTWKKLFQGGIDLFEGYKYFLEIDILAKSDFKSWDGLVETQLRKLISNFIDIPQIKLRLFSVAYDVKDNVYPYSRTINLEYVL